MPSTAPLPTRRSFLVSSIAAAAIPASTAQTPSIPSATPPPSVLGPRPGYTPQVGTLVSELTWMRHAPVSAVKGMSQADLDHLFDAEANSIGALLLHLAAAETFYQYHTFYGRKWADLPPEAAQKWGAPMELGDQGRKSIKGHDLDFYLAALQETRAKTLAELAKRDDAWLMTVDKDWPWGPTNNYCKWFHVCEHESHHSGQIEFLKKRLPGAPKAGES